ncbi:MAG: hypothetical protein IJ226_00665 [Clostridia bacterium]|nr:hypothetical protein [Clostridia bacterium]
MIVCKFGGTSMANAETIGLVKDILDSDAERRYIVVSAPGKRNPSDIKVTDMLISLKRDFDKGQDVSTHIEALRARFVGIATKFLVDFDLDGEFETIYSMLTAGASEDYVKSRGEYLSAKLLSKIFDVPFVDTAELVKFDTDGVDYESTLANLAGALKTCDRAVLPGFYGSDKDGNIVTFSRGGSDISGALVAAAVNADVYENWTDVDGVYTADPRKDSSARHIDRLTYDEMYALALSGANVLHKDAVYPAERAGVPINIKNTFNRYAAGTWIVKE